MATLYIREYGGIGTAPNTSGLGGGAMVVAQSPTEPAIADQTLSITGSAISSNPFSSTTRLVRIHTDSICSIVFGASPVASTLNARLAANQTEYFQVVPGQKVSVILNV